MGGHEGDRKRIVIPSAGGSRARALLTLQICQKAFTRPPMSSPICRAVLVKSAS